MKMTDTISSAQWELLKGTIRRLYLIDNRTLQEVREELERREGLLVTKAQLELKLKQWSMFKNFPPHVWQVVGEEIQRRKLEGNRDSEVVYYGVVLPAKKVQKATTRYCHPRLPAGDDAKPITAKQLAMTGLPVWVRTPSTPPAESPWPENLPWFMFQRHFMNMLLAVSDARVRAASDIVQITSTQMLHFRNTPYKFSKTNWQPPEELSSLLDMIMPESFLGENLVRSETLWRSPHHSTREAVEMIFFVLSNNMPEAASWTKELDLKLLDLLKSSGLLKSSIEAFLPSGQPSALALVDQVFAAAVRMGDADVASICIMTGVDPNQPVPLKSIDIRPKSLPPGFHFVGRWSLLPLHVAICLGHTDLAKRLVKLGANTDTKAGRFSTMDLAIFASASYPEEGYELLQLILSHLSDIPDCDWLCALGYASLCDQLRCVELLLRTFEARINACLKYRQTAVVHAIRARDDEMIQHFLSLGIELNETLESGKCVLWEAVYVRRLDLCEMLLQYGAAPDPPGNEWPSPLQCAAFFGEMEILRLLLSHGAEVNRRINPLTSTVDLSWDLPKALTFGTTALEAALLGGRWEAASFLLAEGAQFTRAVLDIAVRQKMSPIFDYFMSAHPQSLSLHDGLSSAFEAAISTGQTDIIDRIIDANPSLYDTSSLCASVHMALLTRDLGLVTRILRNRPYSTIDYDVLEGTALGIAAHFNDIELVNLFFETGLKPIKCLFPSQRSMLTSFLDWGYQAHDPELHQRWEEESGWWNNPFEELEVISALEAAIAGREVNTVSAMLAAGYKPDSNALCRAAAMGFTAGIQLLLAAGCDVNARQAHRRSPLQAAVRGRKTEETIKLLLENGADVNAEPEAYSPGRCMSRPMVNHSHIHQPRTALQTAVEMGDMKLVELLLKHGAHVNAPAAADAGATALQLAAMHGLIGIARKLLQLGADCNAPGAQCRGRTALEGAAEYGRIDMMQLLLEYGADVHGPSHGQVANAIELATANGHYAAARLLRDQVRSRSTATTPALLKTATTTPMTTSRGQSVTESSADDATSSGDDIMDVHHDNRATTTHSHVHPPQHRTKEAGDEDWFEEFVIIPPDDTV